MGMDVYSKLILISNIPMEALWEETGELNFCRDCAGSVKCKPEKKYKKEFVEYCVKRGVESAEQAIENHYENWLGDGLGFYSKSSVQSYENDDLDMFIGMLVDESDSHRCGGNAHPIKFSHLQSCKDKLHQFLNEIGFEDDVQVELYLITWVSV